jgi:hypothetical protein
VPAPPELVDIGGDEGDVEVFCQCP